MYPEVLRILIRMSRSKRAQIPMDPDEYEQLRRLAERDGKSVAELVRIAVTERYFLTSDIDRKQSAWAGLMGLHPIPVDDWSTMKKELSDRYGAAFP